MNLIGPVESLMPHRGINYQSFKSARLFFREWRAEDAQEVFDYSSDAEWGTYLALPSPYRIQDAKEFIANHSKMNVFPRFSWAITLDDEVLGGINLRYDSDQTSVSIGWAIRRISWRKGYASEAAETLVSLVYRCDPTVSIIHAQSAPQNGSSIRVMIKIGMTVEKSKSGSSEVIVGTVTRESWTSRFPVSDNIVVGKAYE